MLLMKNFIPMKPPGDPFGDWLRKEREKRDWSQADLGKWSGLGRSAINKLENHDQYPTTYNCISLSDALDMPPEDLMRIAGLLPSKRDNNPLENKINYLISKFSTEEDKEDVLAYVELRHRIAEKRGRNETKEKKPKSSRA
jgi:transcriptional regulator with XRE-family HTH domain